MTTCMSRLLGFNYVKIFINSNIIFDSIFCFNSLHEYFNVSNQIRFP